jgi:hypothetical protein
MSFIGKLARIAAVACVLGTATQARAFEVIVGNYVSGFGSIEMFSPANGAPQGTFVQQGAWYPGTWYPTNFTVAPNGDILVSSYIGGDVYRFDRAGNPLGVFIPSGSGGLAGAYDLEWTAGGNLLVTSYHTNQVLEYDGTTGAFVTVRANTGARPIGLAIARNGDIYVGNYAGGTVTRYNSAGTFLGTLMGLNGVGDIEFGPDGNLYITEYRPSLTTGQVHRWNFDAGGNPLGYGGLVATNIAYAYGLAFDAANHLYVTSQLFGTVWEVDLVNNTQSVFISGLGEPTFVGFYDVVQAPAPGTLALCAFALLLLWRRSAAYAADHVAEAGVRVDDLPGHGGR